MKNREIIKLFSELICDKCEHRGDCEYSDNSHRTECDPETWIDQDFYHPMYN